MKKFLLISQHWGNTVYRGGIKIENPMEGKKTLTHLKDLENLKEYHGWSDSGVYYSFKESLGSSWGMETYEVKEDGSLEFVVADYDTSD